MRLGLPSEATLLAKVVQSGDRQEGVVIALFRSAVATREELKAFETSQGIFDRHTVAVPKSVCQFLNEF